MFCKKGVLRNFAIFTGKHRCNFIKKRLYHRCFPVNFAKFLRTPFLQNMFGKRLLDYLVNHPLCSTYFCQQQYYLPFVSNIFCDSFSCYSSSFQEGFKKFFANYFSFLFPFLQFLLFLRYTFEIFLPL